MSGLGHLARRWVGMLSKAPVDAADRAWVEATLTSAERTLWRELTVADQRHSVQVARRFVTFAPDADRDAVAAALLHDIGKLASGLGPTARVIATVVGPRTPRLRRYHDHERIGADMLADAGASPATVALVRGTTSDVDTLHALHAADDI